MVTNIVRSATSEEIENFQRDGVVCLRNAIGPETIKRFEKAIDRLAQKSQLSAAGYDLENLGDVAFSDAERIDYGHAKQYDLELLAGWLRYEDNPRAIETLPRDAPRGEFLLDTGCWKRDDELAKLATSQDMGQLSAQLLGSNNINFFDDQMFVKKPGTKQKTEWHQDYPFFHIDGDQGLVAWIPVDPVTQKNGGMRYVRGSHKWNTNYGASLFISRTLMPGAPGELVPDIDASPDQFDIVSFDTEPGDILIHHFKTLHGARGNLTCTKNRRAMSLRYVGDDVTYQIRPGAPFPPHLTCILNDGDPITCADFPMIYRSISNTKESHFHMPNETIRESR